jgi:hypothetical protein
MGFCYCNLEVDNMGLGWSMLSRSRDETRLTLDAQRSRMSLGTHDLVDDTGTEQVQVLAPNSPAGLGMLGKAFSAMDKL